MIVTIAVIVFLLIFVIVGLCRGFLRVLLSAASLIIALILASTFAQPLAQFANDSTGIGRGVSGKIEDYINNTIDPLTQGAEDARDQIIDSLPLTASMKEELKNNYDIASQVQEGTADFARSIASSISDLVLKVLSFILLFIVILLILKLIMRLSNVINHIPILGGINRLFGGILGLAEGVIFLWTICIVIMMLSGRPAGEACEDVIKQSSFLTFIYEHNYLMTVINSVLGLFKIRL